MSTLSRCTGAGWVALWLATTLAAAEVPSLESVVPPEPLRYAWAQADTLTYAIEIELDHGDEIERQKGTIILTVTPGRDGQALISMPPLRLVSQRTLKPGRAPLVPGFGPPLPRVPVTGPPRLGEFTGHEVTMDGRGRVVSERGDAQLPFALGAFIPLLFQPLPKTAEARWPS